MLFNESNPCVIYLSKIKDADNMYIAGYCQHSFILVMCWLGLEARGQAKPSILGQAKAKP